MNPTVKKLFLAFCAVALGVLFWLFIRSIFFQDPNRIIEHFWSLRLLGIFSAFLLFYGVSISLVAFIVQERAWAQGTLLAAAAAFWLSLVSKWGYEAIGAFVLMWGVVFAMREWVAKENANRIALSVDAVIPRFLSLVFTALALAVAVVFYLSPAAQQLKDIRIPKNVFQKLVSPFELSFQKGVEGSVQSFAGALENAIPGGGEALKFVPAGSQEEETVKRLARPFTEPATSQKFFSEFTEALYNVFNAQVARVASLSPAAQKILSLSLAIALFGILRLLAIPINWLAVILTTIVFNVLVYTGFARVGTKQVDKEVLEL